MDKKKGKKEEAPKADALAKTESQAQLSTESVRVPEYMRDDVGAGTEAMGPQDVTLPRLALAQALTRQMKRTNSLYIEGLREGDLFNTLTKKIYKTPLRILPLFMYKTQMKFHPLDQGGGIDCQSFNAVNGGRYSPKSCATCQFNQWDPKPSCTLFYNYVNLVLPGTVEQEITVMSLKSTGIKVAKGFNSLIRLYGGNTMFSRIYEIQPKPEKNNAGEFYNLLITPLEWTPELLFHAAKALYENLRSRPLKVDIQGAEDEPAPGGAPDEGAGDEPPM